MNDPYLHLRIALARHGLAALAASARSAGEIVLAAAGPAILGVLAAAAIPPALAAARPWYQALPLLLLFAASMTLPCWLLRRHVLPRAALELLHRLPVPARRRWRADAIVAALLNAPLALAYGCSLAILGWQRAPWLGGLRGVAATGAVCLLTWMASTLLLAWRGKLPGPRRRSRPAPRLVAPYAAPVLRWPALLLWRHLFWTPAWHGASTLGLRQTLLLCGACASAVLWMQQAAAAPLLGCATSALFILLTHLGDQAVRAQIGALRPHLAGLPLALGPFTRLVRALTLAPALLAWSVLLLAGLRSGAWSHLAGRLYLVLSAGLPLLLVLLPAMSARARVAAAGAAILILTAVGSER